MTTRATLRKADAKRLFAAAFEAGAAEVRMEVDPAGQVAIIASKAPNPSPRPVELD